MSEGLKNSKGSSKPLLLSIAAIALIAGGILWTLQPTSSKAEEITMYKNIGCQCCTNWAKHLINRGHKVVEKPLSNIDAIKKRYGIKEEFQGCHTALIGGYVVEGHVPMKEIERLLKERPDAKGLSVPGMPMGSDGMEAPGRQADKYTVFLLKKDGSSEVYARY